MNNGGPLLFQPPPLNVTIPQPDAADVQAHAQAMAAAGMGAPQMANYSGMAPPGIPGMPGLQNLGGMHSIPVSDGNGGWYYISVMPQGAGGPGGQGPQGHPMLLGLQEGDQGGMGPGAMGLDPSAAAAHGGPHAGGGAGRQAELDNRGAGEAGAAGGVGPDGVGNQGGLDGSRPEGGAGETDADKALQDGEHGAGQGFMYRSVHRGDVQAMHHGEY